MNRPSGNGPVAPPTARSSAVRLLSGGRSLARRLGRSATRRAMAAVDPSAALARHWAGEADAQPLVITMVYRERNARVVERMLRGLPPEADVRLWALDEVPVPLAPMTVGQGPGLRFALHEDLLAVRPVAEDATWLLCDDDVDLGRSSLPMVAALSRAAGLDVAGPTHTWNSFLSHPFSARQHGTIVRYTAFVEIGPVVCFSPRARRELLPLPKASDMGFGAEAHWSTLTHPHLRCGLLDGAPLRHLSRPGGSYAFEEAVLEGEKAAAEHGYASFGALLNTFYSWRAWEPPPATSDVTLAITQATRPPVQPARS